MVVLREEHDPLELGKLHEQLEGRGADVAVVLGALVAPGVVTETPERHGQADERHGVVAQLPAEGRHAAKSEPAGVARL
jgi:hypothetical protein